MEFQDYWVLKIYNRKNPDTVLHRYYYDKLSEARFSFTRRKGRGDLARLILETCQGLVVDYWEREE